MPKKVDLKKVMVIGSGPIIIGQAAEFDYAGTQACRALKEEGYEVILVNSNPATIMTDANIADKVYIEPLNVEFLQRIIKQEKPDGLLPTLGGQVGLNLAMELAEQGILAEEGVELLGTPLQAIKKAEDREMFKQMMNDIMEPVPESAIVSTVEDAIDFANGLGYPVIVRPAYTLGGTGGGVADNEGQLREIANTGIKHSIIDQILVEKSVKGWKEIEYEVVRDANDNCITICSMENFDPVGVHTGDSIVAAPAQTLTDPEHQMLRSSAIKIIRALGVEGGCNVQYALSPVDMSYYVIEVNPRVSRSSALASKATGYPIAKVAAKIAVGLALDEIRNAVTKKTYACFEPTLDYVVLKVPRWPFDKFASADRQLGTQMKATGEVMSIDRTFEAALLKSIRSLELGLDGLELMELKKLDADGLRKKMLDADDERIFAIAEEIRRGTKISLIAEMTEIDPYFLKKIENIVQMEKKITASDLNEAILKDAKKMGFGDAVIARLQNRSENEVRALRKSYGLNPVYKLVDTCAAEFEAVTPYYYSCMEDEDEAIAQDLRKVIVLGSGPIRIGQGVEFDYCSVHSVWALKDAGFQSIIINNNPETVSTDFDTADRLYFEPLVHDDVLNIIEKENPEGVIVQFGGQTAINLAERLATEGVKILGTSMENINRAEDRDEFEQLLQKLDIPRPDGKTATSVEEAVVIAHKIGYPVLVRPSYVLGGRAMEIVYNDEMLLNYMTSAVKVNPNHPVLVDKYMVGKEVEVDAICDGKDVLIPGIMEHIERAGVHSGDSIAVYPNQTLSEKNKEQIIDYTTKLALGLDVRGLVNIQFVIYEDEVYVIEVNPRSSRTVPYLSKITGIPMVNLATKIILGKTLEEMGYQNGLYPEIAFVTVKVPVFSFSKLTRVDTGLGPEMKSTGEVMGVGATFEEALYKGMISAGMILPQKGNVLVTVSDLDKPEAVELMKRFSELGFNLTATGGTADVLEAAGLKVDRVNKIREGSPNIIDLIRKNEIQFVINTLTRGKDPEKDGFKIRRVAVEMGIPAITSLDTARVFMEVLEKMDQISNQKIVPLQKYSIYGKE